MELILTALIILSVYVFVRFYYRPKKRIQVLANRFRKLGYKVYVYPFSPFLSGFFSQIARDTVLGDAMKSLKDQFTHYDVSISNIREYPRIAFTNPILIKQFTSAQKEYKLQKATITAKAFQRLAKGIVFSQRQLWKKKRRIISNIFTYQFVTSRLQTIGNLFDKALENSEKSNRNLQGQVQYPLINFTSMGACSVIMQCFLGCQSHQLLLEGESLCGFIIKTLDNFIEQLIDPISLVLGLNFIKMGLRKKDRQMNKLLRKYNDWGKVYIQNKLIKSEKINKNDAPSDLIEALLMHNSQCANTGNIQDIYSKQEILDEFKMFLIAGTDTTSHLLQMMIYYISKNKHVQQKVRQQIEDIMPQEEYKVDILKKMVYIDAIIKQTLRIYGPANFVFIREATQDFYFADQIPISKGTYLTYLSVCMHYSQQYFQKPHQFRPERWLNNQCVNIDPYTFISFNVGSRTCIGRQLALFEAKIGLIKFIRRYHTFSVPDQKLNMFFKFAYVSEDFKIKAQIRDIRQ